MLHLEKYMIPIIKPTFYPINDIGNWIKLLLYNATDDFDFYLRKYEIVDIKNEMYNTILNELMELTDNIFPIRKPNGDWIDIIESEILKFVDMLLNTESCKKYYNVLLPYSKVDFLESSNSEYSTVISVMYPLSEKYYIARDQWTRMNLEILTNKFEDKGNDLTYVLNPYTTDWYGMLNTLIYEFVKKRFSYLSDYIKICDTGFCINSRVRIMFGRNEILDDQNRDAEEG